VAGGFGKLAGRTAFILVQDKHLAVCARRVFTRDLVADWNRVLTGAVLAVELPVGVVLVA